MGSPPKPTELYRGVRQYHWGKWDAEIWLPKNRTRLCGDFGEYIPSHSFVDAKLQAICESLELNQKQRKKEKKKKSSKDSEGGDYPSSLFLVLSENKGSTKYSPLSGLTFLDFNKQPRSEIVTSSVC
ncbi:hypothetical protein J1N35_040186 [Gossypium stocksii]|uniref:AP2/ERF domain-containing protein n=1 Tax=Gossypium stocksii TaxID=47602 RepID=A0A9D3ZIA4_9ROSI|nr:hypothetical protein J1N35_040186 [Gossypium stocksii]